MGGHGGTLTPKYRKVDWEMTSLQQSCMPRRPIPLRLGDDARSLPWKNGLLPEYYYVREPVSVAIDSATSTRLVGEVQSMTGDFVSNSGVMILAIGGRDELHLPYTNVPNYVSKLLGNYYILGDDVIGAEGHGARTSAVLDYVDKQGGVFLKGIFDAFSETSNHTEALIRTTGLQNALQRLGVPVAVERAEELMVMTDLDEKGGLDFESFRRAAVQPPTPLEQWAGMLPLAGMLASSLPIGGGQGDQPLRDFSRLREDEIDTAVEAFKVGLRRLLLEAKASMRQMFDNVDAKASEAARDSASGVSAVSKFKSFKMSTGTVADYHDGLSSRIGTFLDFILNEVFMYFQLYLQSLHGVLQERRIPTSPWASRMSTA
jgi:hypothetical protein